MAIVVIDGVVKTMATALRKDSNADPMVVARVTVEFATDSSGQEAIKKLVGMLDAPIRCQITDVQLELPRAAAK